VTSFKLHFQSIPEDRLEEDQSRDGMAPEEAGLASGITAGDAEGLKQNVIRSGSSRKKGPQGRHRGRRGLQGGKMMQYGAKPQRHRASSLEHLVTQVHGAKSHMQGTVYSYQIGSDQ